MRLFIALPFSEAFRQVLLDGIRQLRDQSQGGNFTRPENLHLTLAFIGESDRMADARRVMEGLSTRPFKLELGESGAFGDLHWVGLRRCPPLDRLARELRQGLLDAGFDIDRKPFRPHITLARQLRADQPPRLTLAPAAMEATEFSLMCSERIAGKLTYTPLFTRQL